MSGALKSFLEGGGIEVEMAGDGMNVERLIDAAAREPRAAAVSQSCSNGGAAMTTIIRGPSQG